MVKKGSDLDKQVAKDSSKLIVSMKKDLEKKYPDISIKLGSEEELSYYSTGILTLDYALSGGVPEGHITEFFGEEQSGKTLVAYLMIAEMQRRYPDKATILVDSENAFDPRWAKVLGINVERLLVVDEPVLEDAFQVLDDYIANYPVSLAVVDSLAAFVTKREASASVTDAANKVSDLARAGTVAVRKLHGRLIRTRTSLIVINQVRETMDPYGPQWRTSGGKAFKHLGWTRIQIKKPSVSKQLKDGKRLLGYDTECIIVKHRGNVLSDDHKVTIRVWSDSGLDKVFDLSQVLVSMGKVERAGSYYLYNGQKFQGFDAFMKYLSQPEVFEVEYNKTKEEIQTLTKETEGQS